MNFLDYIGEIILWMIIIWFGLKLIESYLKAKNEILQEELKELTNQLKNKIIHVNIEKHGSVFYLFEKDSNRFIAQGSDFEELRQTCNVRFKNAVVVADVDELKKYGLE